MITGRAKFFDKSQCLAVDGAEASATSGNASALYCIDRNQYTYWRSVGSSDGVTELLTIVFAEDKTIDRLFLLDHNFEDFNVKYDVSGVWTHFSGVSGLDGSLSNITQTGFADNSAYYEFTPVTTGSIQISVSTTQVPDAEKFLSQVIVTSELGTLQGFPKIGNLSHSKNEKTLQALSGRVVSLKSEESFGVSLSFENYPTDSTYQADFELMFELFDRDENFLVWLCGGRRGSTYFRYQVRGFRLKDVYEVQTIGNLSPQYMSNVYINPLNLVVNLSEAV